MGRAHPWARSGNVVILMPPRSKRQRGLRSGGFLHGRGGSQVHPDLISFKPRYRFDLLPAVDYYIPVQICSHSHSQSHTTARHCHCCTTLPPSAQSACDSHARTQGMASDGLPSQRIMSVRATTTKLSNTPILLAGPGAINTRLRTSHRRRPILLKVQFDANGLEQGARSLKSTATRTQVISQQ